MTEPSISVVVPTYNRANLVGITLRTVLAQDAPPAEVIVVDDGSTDGTSEVLREFGPCVRVIRVANGGDLAARNVGLRAATGDLVAFCDSDDLWAPGFLGTLASVFRHAPHVMTAYGNFRHVNDDAWGEQTKFDAAPPGFWAGLRRAGPEGAVFDVPIVERLIEFQPFFPSAMMANRTRFLQIGGWDEVGSRIVGSDFATALRAAEHSLGVVHRAMVGVRRHANNLSRDMQAMNLGDAHILERLLEARPSLAPHREAVLASIARRRADAADLAFDRRDFGSVRQIHNVLPESHLPFKRRLKAWISRLPEPVARPAAQLASRLAG